MEERSVIHGTYVIERSYPSPPQLVFAAFSDPVKKRRWFGEGGSSQIEKFEMDFRVGGSERTRFRFNGDTVCLNDTVYQDIVPQRRIVIAYTMAIGDKRISSSQVTVELLPLGNGTNLIFTEQAAFFEGADGLQIREAGWRQLLKQLAEYLAG